MRARYDGECAACDGSIRAGVDEITRDADGAWVHANLSDCDALERAAASDVVCEFCHLVMPCWCPPAVQDPQRAASEALARYKAAAARDPFEGFL